MSGEGEEDAADGTDAVAMAMELSSTTQCNSC